MDTRRLLLFPLGFGAAGVLWGLSSGYEAGDSAIGTGLLGLTAGVVVALCVHAGSSWRR